MLEVDRLLREIYIQQRGQMDFVVFSDHGNSHVQNRRIDLDGFLAQHGFRSGICDSQRKQRRRSRFRFGGSAAGVLPTAEHSKAGSSACES